MNVYMSYPIDKIDEKTNAKVQKVVDEIILAIVEKCKQDDMSWCVFTPHTAFRVAGSFISRAVSDMITAVNFQALTECDAMVLIYSKGTETWGCPIEAWHARNNGIPIVVVSIDGKDEDPEYYMPSYLKACLKGGSVVLSDGNDGKIGLTVALSLGRKSKSKEVKI